MRVKSHNRSAPNVDRSQLQQILAGLDEGIVLIDPDGRIAWANDAALTSHGVSELAQLGATVAGYRSRFRLRYRNHRALPPGHYPVERALAGELFENVLVELSTAQSAAFQRVHRLRSLVLRNAAGALEWLVLAIEDVTARCQAEERFEHSFAAHPAALVCRLSDLCCVKVNAGFLAMTGCARADILRRSALDLGVLDSGDESPAKLRADPSLPQREVTLRFPGRASQLVLVAGQPIELAGEACLLLSFIDLEPRSAAKRALRHSEDRFSSVFQLAPVPMALLSRTELRTLDVNAALVAMTGYLRSELLASGASPLPPWAEPEALEAMRGLLEGEGRAHEVEIAVCTRLGGRVDFVVCVETVVFDGEACLLCALQDITERKRSEMELITAIEAVMEDSSWFSRRVLEKLAQMRHAQGPLENTADLADLTPRERVILGLISQGSSDADIATALNISRHTVRNHASALYAKIGVHRRSAAIVWARERGVID